VIFGNKKQLIKHQYTIVELLVVLVVTGLLTGLTVSGIKGALARQGAAGAVRTLGTKISLAQSFAVSRNRYVALLLPDYSLVNSDLGGSTESSTGTNIPIPASNTANIDDEYLFTQNRMCYVEKVLDTTDKDGDGKTDDYIYSFERWVSGYEWQKLPSKTVAFVVSDSSASVDDSSSCQVFNVDGTANKSSSALIFKPSGALVSAQDVVVRVYRAAYLPEREKKKFFWQGTETPEKGWKIGINGFTGRTSFCLGGENVND
jgi:type II secretory pathway pseudopilin PulG